MRADAPRTARIERRTGLPKRPVGPIAQHPAVLTRSHSLRSQENWLGAQRVPSHETVHLLLGRLLQFSRSPQLTSKVCAFFLSLQPASFHCPVLTPS